MILLIHAFLHETKESEMKKSVCLAKRDINS